MSGSATTRAGDPRNFPLTPSFDHNAGFPPELTISQQRQSSGDSVSGVGEHRLVSLLSWLAAVECPNAGPEKADSARPRYPRKRILLMGGCWPHQTDPGQQEVRPSVA